MSKITSATLWHYPISRSVRVRFLLEELGLPYELIRVNVIGGDAMKPEFLERNPNHAVPVLDLHYEDGSNQIMFESGAMVLFLADAFPERELAPAPTDLKARAEYLKWVVFNAAHMDTVLWNIRLTRDMFPKPMRSPAITEFNMNKVKTEIIPQLEAQLANHRWLAGDSFTAADCIFAQNLNWLRAYGFGKEGRLAEYFGQLVERPAFQKAYEDRKEFER